MRALCVFLGSSAGTHPAYAEAAIATGREIARRGLTCVYGGSNTGLMRLLADSALAAGGRVIGVTIEALRQRERPHTGLTALHVVPTMHEREGFLRASHRTTIFRAATPEALIDRMLAGQVS